ncbi:YggS family pyridoxal phosphate-dependent enzyme [Candidatus Paracaedibacter symbiosus]|uniref:YggS family pyridoxal phosphate-dependent enzyme n=1 Tax=Candidatus Paracaedibacter symbiosus TaxID=244582 RepID=UPI000A4EFCE6|nr:YggS family pyridoxal phosphate-dependent enzyme [Candidatus Paracaedibacter symbiosus]
MIPLLDNYTSLVATVSHNAQTARQSIPEVLAASKAQSSENLETLLAYGHRLFGENRVQEAAAKWPLLKQRYPDCQLHLIGPLQTNKVKQAVQLFDVIETLDRPTLAHALAKTFAKFNIRRTLLIQVNTGSEPQKAGVLPKEFESLLALARGLNLPVVGLMCVPPIDADPSPHFAMLQTLAKAHSLSYLSMGMSHDYQTAIAYGTSWIRVGTALFGAR